MPGWAGTQDIVVGQLLTRLFRGGVCPPGAQPHSGRFHPHSSPPPSRGRGSVFCPLRLHREGDRCGAATTPELSPSGGGPQQSRLPPCGGGPRWGEQLMCRWHPPGTRRVEARCGPVPWVYKAVGTVVESIGLPGGVIGNTPESGSGKSRFEPWPGSQNREERGERR